MKIATINARGISSLEKRSVLFQWSKDNHIDILCVQETFCTINNVSKIDKDWDGTSFHCHSDSNHSRGVSTFIRKIPEIEIINHHISIDGRRLLLNIKHNTENYTIVNIYAPNNENERIKFFKKLLTWIRQHSININRIILCGDFNSTLSIKDRSSRKLDKTAINLQNLINNLDLNDTYRFKHPDDIVYTYSNSTGTAQSRIDFIFNSLLLNGNIKKNRH